MIATRRSPSTKPRPRTPRKNGTTWVGFLARQRMRGPAHDGAAGPGRPLRAIFRRVQVIEQLGPDRVRPLRRVEYDRLVALGFFADERLELLRGVLVAMSPQGALHAEVVRRLGRLFTKALDDRAMVRVQSPLAV